MIGALLRRLAGGSRQSGQSGQGEAILPENLGLAYGHGVRLIKPGQASGYATLANTPQGFFIFNHHNPGVGWRTLAALDYQLYELRDNFICVLAGDPGSAALSNNMQPRKPQD